MQSGISLDPSLAALLGIVLTALVAALGFYGRIRRERLRTTRIALYLLLRLYLHHSTSQMALAPFAGAMTGALQSALDRRNLPGPKEDYSETRAKIESSLRATAKRETRRVEVGLQSELAQAISELAKDDPLLAMRLSSLGFLEGSDPEPETPAQDIEPAGSIRAVVAQAIQDAISDANRNHAVERLLAGVRLAATATGVLTRLRVEYWIWRASRIDGAQFVQQGADALVEEMVARAVSKTATAAPVNGTPAPRSET